MLWTIILALFIICTVVQAYYLLKVFGGLAYKKSLQSPLNTTQHPVSVLICAHNEKNNLARLLPAIFSQQYPQFQVVISLDRCNDGSMEWLQDQQAQWPHLKIVEISKTPAATNSKKFALLQAIEAADHDVLLLTDADCYPMSNRWMEKMSAGFNQEVQIVLGYSPYEKAGGLLNAFIRYETLLTGIQYLSRALDGHPYMGVGRNLAYRKSYFKASEGLKPFMHVTGGDDDLFVNYHAGKHNTRVCLGKHSLMTSIPKNRFIEFLAQKKRHLSVGKKYKTRDKFVLGIFSLSHIIFWSSLVSLLITATHMALVIALFIFRQFVLSILINRSTQRLGDRFPIGMLPVVDFLYSVYYGYIGLVALTSNKINWR